MGVRDHPEWLRHAADVSVLISPDARILDITESVEQLFGYSSEEVIGSSIAEWIHPEDLDHVSTTFLRILEETGRQVPMSCRLHQVTGRWIDIEAVSVLALQETNGVVISLRDVTARRKFDRALEQIATGASLEGNLGLLAEIAEDIVEGCAAVFALGCGANAHYIGGPRGRHHWPARHASPRATATKRPPLLHFVGRVMSKLPFVSRRVVIATGGQLRWNLPLSNSAGFPCSLRTGPARASANGNSSIG
jgi:PAS domain S-box-containing protein